MRNQDTSGFYDRLVTSESTGKGLSCGYKDRYDPTAMRMNVALMSRLRVVFNRALAGYKGPFNSILDIGCGTLFYSTILGERFDSVTGVDSSSSMLRVGLESQDPGFSAVLTSVESLPFDESSFDCIFGLDVLHHVGDPRLVLAEAYRVLKPGGIIINIEPNMANPGMLLAHLLPAEERGAVLLNWSWRLRSLFELDFAGIRLTYYNLPISSSFSSMVNILFPFRAWSHPPWGVRMVVTGRKT